MSSKDLEFVFYQNPLAVLNLDVIGIDDSPDILVVELSASSVLAPVFDQQAKLRFGPAGLLGDIKRASTIPKVFRGSQRKIILGSRPTVPVQSSVAALSELGSLDTPFRRIIVMLHLSEVDKFIYGLQLAATFAVLLKRSDVVPVGLLRAVDRLKRLESIDETTWKGMAFYGEAQDDTDDRDHIKSLPSHLRPLLVSALLAETVV